MLRVSNLRKGFGSGSRRLEVLKGINMEVKPGELVSLMGPSGCGKSALLNIIRGLLEADAGHPGRAVALHKVLPDVALVVERAPSGYTTVSEEISGYAKRRIERRAHTRHARSAE